MTINENKMLSRNRKRRINRKKNKINDDVKLLLNKIKSEKNKNKIVDKIKHLEILSVRIKHADKPDNLESA